MYTKVETGEKAVAAIRQIVVANQNKPSIIGDINAPQWYEVKYMVEHMFDLRAKVRDAIEMRRHAEQVKVRYNAHPSRQIVIAEIHGHNMQIALSWHEYREAAAQYYYAWAVYKKNLRR